jgi:Serine dehydrogenase proteinase
VTTPPANPDVPHQEPRPPDAGQEQAWSPPTGGKTPLFEAFNAGRYQRQAMIRDIQSVTGRTLVSYTAAPGVPIDREDVLPVVDLLHHIRPGSDIDLLLHTSGGDMDASEKVASMLWSKIGATGTLRVIVPDYAKSAGTLLAIAADTIVMSDSSELGPIDPQLVRRTPDGGLTVTAVQHHLEAYDECRTTFKNDPDDPAAAHAFSQFNPVAIHGYRTVVNRARQLSDKHLKEGMFRRGTAGPYTAITSSLLDTRQWLSHSQMIGRHEAQQIGLNIDYRDTDDTEWQAWWRLHCHQRLTLAASDARKLFESDPVWLQLE